MGGVIIGYLGIIAYYWSDILFYALMLLGNALIYIGFGIYLKAKGRSLWWLLLLFLGLIGIVIMHFLGDSYDNYDDEGNLKEGWWL